MERSIARGMVCRIDQPVYRTPRGDETLQRMVSDFQQAVNATTKQVEMPMPTLEESARLFTGGEYRTRKVHGMKMIIVSGQKALHILSFEHRRGHIPAQDKLHTPRECSRCTTRNTSCRRTSYRKKINRALCQVL